MALAAAPDVWLGWRLDFATAQAAAVGLLGTAPAAEAFAPVGFLLALFWEAPGRGLDVAVLTGLPEGCGRLSTVFGLTSATGLQFTSGAAAPEAPGAAAPCARG